jgi:hypothetical protein
MEQKNGVLKSMVVARHELICWSYGALNHVKASWVYGFVASEKHV